MSDVWPTTAEDRPICGCLGCIESAEATIRHPRHGETVVCGDHADGHEVIDDV